MYSLWQDIRLAFRMLAKSPGITLAAILAFGMGIGANTAVFSVSNAFLRHPISFPEADRIVMVLGRAPGQTEGWSEISPGDFQDWRTQSHSFESLAAYDWADINLTGVGEPVRLQGFRVSSNFFDVLHAQPILGRGFIKGEDERGQDRVAVLSAALWRRQFASSPTIVGRVIQVNGVPTQIVGVMNNKVRFPESAEIWVPLALTPEEKAMRTDRYVAPVGRLAAGISLEQAHAEMDAIQGRLETLYPETEKGWGVQCMTISDFIAGPGKSYCIMSLVAVGFLLLIACTNVTNLLIARSAARQNEFAIRLALGASRLRLIRQVLVESVLLAAAGTLAGLLLGSWWISLFRGAMPPEVERFIPTWDQVHLDSGTFLYTLAVALAAGILSGLFPAVRGFGGRLQETLREAGRGGDASVSRVRFRGALLVAQVALSLVLLVGAALMAKGLQTLFALNFKFDPDSVLTFQVALSNQKYATPEQRTAFFNSLTDRLNHTAGIAGAVAAHQLPFTGGDTEPFSIEGQPLQPGEFHAADFNHISTAFFQLLHIRVREGREFSERDSADAPRVAIVSEKFAKRFWPESSPLGHRIKPGNESSKEPWVTIVGVVPEVMYNPWLHEPPPTIYFPLAQRPLAYTYVAVRTNGDPRALIPAMRSAVSGIDVDQPIFDVLPLNRVISNEILGLSYAAVLLGVVGIMALGLSAVGVSGVMAHSVSQRVHEIGVRMALGANPRDVLLLIVGQGLKLLGLGVCIGLPLAFALARLLSSLLFGVESSDSLSFLGGALLLTAAVLLACYLPARQAMRVDPMVALRYE